MCRRWRRCLVGGRADGGQPLGRSSALLALVLALVVAPWRALQHCGRICAELHKPPETG
jgi:hypothetical protein